MAYTAMYRKFRPDSFEEVKGQDPIVTTLRNQIAFGRIGHAYLFCGTRGTGKTSVAKLFAKAINCENPVNGNPCNTCPVCRAIASGSSMNVIEIDAASNNGVENIREIVEEVRYSPTEGNYKVYIIDEVHMLSAGAFNALLKTLEEPPSYVVFILATTEVHMIPITILSRCQRYDFKRVDLGTISARLQDLCGREGIKAEPAAMDYIARLAEGSVRDALSLLERCVSFYFEQEITYERVLDVLGAVDIEVFARMLRRIHQREALNAVRILEEVVTDGRELNRFIVDLTWYARNLLLAQGGENLSEVLDISAEQMQLLNHEAKVFHQEELIRYIQEFCELTNQLRYSTQKRVLIEMALIRMCRPQSDTDTSGILERIRLLEDEIAHLKKNGVSVAPPSDEKEEEAGETELTEALPEDIAAVVDDWDVMAHRFPPPMRLFLEACTVALSEKSGYLLLVFKTDLDYDYMNKEQQIYEVQKMIARVTGKDIKVELKLLEANESIRKYPDLRELRKRIKHLEIEDAE